MITSISIEGFKSLKKVDLELGNLNIFIGANASGKSNFFDALRVLQGIGYGFTIDEIFNGKPKSANSEVWDGIRGGSAKAGFVEQGRSDAHRSDSIHFDVEARDSDKSDGSLISYSVMLSPEDGFIHDERMSLDYKGSRTEVHNKPDSSGDALYKSLLSDKAAKKVRLFNFFIHALSNIQHLDPSPAILREYSLSQHVKRMGERGENFASLVKTILADEATRSAYLSWLQQLTPTELDDVTVLSGAMGESLFALKENGVDYPAPILSDGTLRFAAIVAAFFQPDMPDILMIEEIENNIHPSRLRLLLELLKSQSKSDRQIIATTHSPILLSWLTEEDYKTTFLCRRNEETGASEITPLSEIPRFMELASTQSIGDLLTEGWLEAAL